ncbi:hypothetical protein MY3296_005892, partial [Beauveria thailandica]
MSKSTKRVPNPTYESARQEERDWLLDLEHQQAAEQLCHHLWDKRDMIAALVAHHLALEKEDSCTVLPTEHWICGGFNICIPVEVTMQGGPTNRLIFRCPRPHKLAEDRYPGTINEKIGCEAATYVWMQEHCSTVRIPHLYAFGFLDGDHFTHIERRPFLHRTLRRLCRWAYSWLGLPLLSNYVRDSAAPSIGTAYFLLEYLDPTVGQMLSLTWARYKNDPSRRTRLYRGLAHVMLSLARVPQSVIGSYQFNALDSTIRLTNRPLICSTIIMENSDTPRTIHNTYQDVGRFTSDMLTMHDNYLLHQPHAVRDADDAQERFAIRTLLRAVSHHFTNPCRDGPYLLQLTDMHQSNLFVDEEWNVTGVIDLEWICSLPVEMLSVPYWLTDCSIDSIIGEDYNEFERAHEEFLVVMDQELGNIGSEHNIRVTETMRQTWLSGGTWFWACIRSLNGWLFVFDDHILPRFSNKQTSDLKQVSALWQRNIDSVIMQKIHDEEEYLGKLRNRLGEDTSSSNKSKYNYIQ